MKIDTADPVTTQSGADSAWHRFPVTLVFAATDSASGVAGTAFSTDGGFSWTPGASLTVSVEGITTVGYRSTDLAGNTEVANTVDVKVDTTAPSTTDDAPSAWQSGDVTVNLTPDDGSGSGMSGGAAKTQYKLDGARGWTTGTSACGYIRLRTLQQP